MTGNSKTTVVIVPGAWHPASLYDGFVSRLQESGYGAVVAAYPSVDSPNPKTATCEQDAQAVRQQCLSLIENESKDVLLVCHSYGGIPGGGAAAGLSKKERVQKGKQGGILGLVYMSAFVVPEGSSLLTFLGGKHAPYLVPDTPSEGMTIVSPAIETLFNDVDQETAARLSTLLLPHAILAFESPAPSQAWGEAAYEGRRAFLRCLQDQALPTFVQDMFVQRSGVAWDVKDVDAGHDSFISHLNEVCEAVVGYAGSFQAE
ncbi:MAG: hypothetical protein LQ349_006656 [Xanthoria aureola]|nr:MAG: hypothetical protein LQ349_006656 [Xanthoria aureola]